MALFEPLKIGNYELAHRIVMAPLTRCRAIGKIPHPNAAIYYTQRATPGGLLICEGTSPTETGYGYPHTPGIFLPEHVEGWKPITKAVKEKGAIFFCQLWHVGRMSTEDYQPNGAAPLSSSPFPIDDGTICYTEKGTAPKPSTPKEMTVEDIKREVEGHAHAAKCAMEAGFDGVEIHCANGYFFEQFIKDGINKRTDKYGGPIENRARAVLECVAAVVDAVGVEKVGIRFSPFTTFLDASTSDPYADYTYIVEQLAQYNLAYVHFVEPRTQPVDLEDKDVTDSLEPFRKAWKGVFLAAGGYNADNGEAAVSSGHADAVVYGRWFIANPDLPKRLKLKAPLNPYNRKTFYTQDPVVGYIDYPFLETAEQDEQIVQTVTA